MHNAHVWGWEIPVYLFLGGMAAGLMIISAIAPKRDSRAMRLLPFAAPLVLSLGMLALFLDLGNKLHVFRFYTAFRITSPMSWGSWILLAIYPVSILYGFTPTRGLQRANLVLGIALGAYTGILLSALGARALWASPLLAPLFLVSGFSSAAAVALVLPLHEDERAFVRRWDVMAIAGELAILTFLFVGLLADGGSRGRAAVALFFGGPFTATFWALVVILGLAAPLLLEMLEQRRHLRAVALAPSFLLIGGLALRWIFVAAGQI
ncbi:MAG TPA: NrfD/PsrC family molybdoenzyme membrane anchor subunit [Thermoanaerobaculia bacterium]